MLLRRLHPRLRIGNSPSRRPIFFCHIPKTAGTTLRKALEARFPASEIVPNHEEILANSGVYPSTQNVFKGMIDRRKYVNLVLGHYHYSFHKILGDPITIVVLREPIARSISLLKHMITYGGVPREHILMFLNRGKFPAPDNEMTRYLVGTLDVSSSDTLDQQHHRLITRPLEDRNAIIAEAEAVLESVDILGVTERFEQLQRPLAALGVALPDERHNRALIEDLELTDRQLETIKAHNMLDSEVYRHASRIVEAREAGGT